MLPPLHILTQDTAKKILQNKAAKVVTGKSWYTPVRRLLKDCKWLSVNQIILYQTAVLSHKILQAGLSAQQPRDTRQAAGGSIWRGQD